MDDEVSHGGYSDYYYFAWILVILVNYDFDVFTRDVNEATTQQPTLAAYLASIL